MDLFSSPVFSTQLDDFFPFWDTNLPISRTSLLQLLRTSFMLGDNRTGVRYIKNIAGSNSFQSNGIYIYSLVPQAGMIPWRTYANGSWIYKTDGTNLSVPPSSSWYGQPFPFCSSAQCGFESKLQIGSYIEDHHLGGAESNLFQIGAFWGNIDTANYATTTSKSVAGSGDISPVNVVDDEAVSFSTEPNCFISPAMFDLIYKNARRAAVTPQILISVPYNDESYNIRYIDPLYNKSMLLKNYNGLVPFESETLANGDYYLYIFWMTSSQRGYTFAKNEIKCAYVDDNKVVLVKTGKAPGDFYVGRIPAIPSDGKKYTRKRVRFIVKDSNNNDISPTYLHWDTYATTTYSPRVAFIAWIGGYSKELCDGVP